MRKSEPRAVSVLFTANSNQIVFSHLSRPVSPCVAQNKNQYPISDLAYTTDLLRFVGRKTADVPKRSSAETFTAWGGNGGGKAVGFADNGAFYSAHVSTYIDDTLKVEAGKNTDSADIYYKKDRYNAVWDNRYATK